MSVRPVTINNVSNTPKDMKASMLAFAKLKENCKGNYLTLAAKQIKEGTKTVKAEDLVKGEIKFAEVRLKEITLLSKMIEERVRNNTSNEQIQISSMLAEMIKNHKSKSEEVSL